MESTAAEMSRSHALVQPVERGARDHQFSGQESVGLAGGLAILLRASQLLLELGHFEFQVGYSLPTADNGGIRVDHLSTGREATVGQTSLQCLDLFHEAFCSC